MYKLMHHTSSNLNGCDVLWFVPRPAAGTVLDFLSNFRDVEPFFVVHPCLSGFIFGDLRSRAYIATCMGAIVMFSMKDSFVDGRL